MRSPLESLLRGGGLINQDYELVVCILWLRFSVRNAKFESRNKLQSHVNTIMHDTSVPNVPTQFKLATARAYNRPPLVELQCCCAIALWAEATLSWVTNPS